MSAPPLADKHTCGALPLQPSSFKRFRKVVEKGELGDRANLGFPEDFGPESSSENTVELSRGDR